MLHSSTFKDTSTTFWLKMSFTNMSTFWLHVSCWYCTWFFQTFQRHSGSKVKTVGSITDPQFIIGYNSREREMVSWILLFNPFSRFSVQFFAEIVFSVPWLLNPIPVNPIKPLSQLFLQLQVQFHLGIITLKNEKNTC